MSAADTSHNFDLLSIRVEVEIGAFVKCLSAPRLATRMATEQRALIEQAAEADVSPAAGTMRRIADLESALAAVEAMVEESASDARHNRPRLPISVATELTCHDCGVT